MVLKFSGPILTLPHVIWVNLLSHCSDLAIDINSFKIKSVDRKDYLGLTLDEKFEWDKQVHEM